MDERLDDLYRIPERVLPQEVYLLELSQQCSYAEQRVRQIAEKLPQWQRQIIESYIDLRDELEFQSVKTALRFGRK